jgi:hypothetical protein
LHSVGTNFPSGYTDKCFRNFLLPLTKNLRFLANQGIADTTYPQRNDFKQQLANPVTWYIYDHVTTRLIMITVEFKLFVSAALFLTDTSFSLSAKKLQENSYGNLTNVFEVPYFQNHGI